MADNAQIAMREAAKVANLAQARGVLNVTLLHVAAALDVARKTRTVGESNLWQTWGGNNAWPTAERDRAVRELSTAQYAIVAALPDYPRAFGPLSPEEKARFLRLVQMAYVAIAAVDFVWEPPRVADNFVWAIENLPSTLKDVAKEIGETAGEIAKGAGDVGGQFLGGLLGGLGIGGVLVGAAIVYLAFFRKG